MRARFTPRSTGCTLLSNILFQVRCNPPSGVRQWATRRLLSGAMGREVDPDSLKVVAFALTFGAGAAGAWPVDHLVDVEVGPIASKNWARRAGWRARTLRSRLPSSSLTGELFLEGKAPGRTLLLLYAKVGSPSGG